MHVRTMIALLLASGITSTGHAQAWKKCIPNSVGPGGCDSVGPGGGKSVGPGGGLSVGPGGGMSVGPGGGQSMGSGGGRSIAPGGGLAPDRNWNRGVDPRTMRPAPGAPNLPGGKRQEGQQPEG